MEDEYGPDSIMLCSYCKEQKAVHNDPKTRVDGYERTCCGSVECCER